MATKKALNFGLLGKNIAYSFSPGYFAKKFERENLSHCHYQNFDCADVAEVVDVIQRDDIKGLNVTIPYKEAVIPTMDELSPTAATIGAVNTIIFTKEGKRIGDNTDAYGFERALFDHYHKQPKKALILGTGGASKAVAYVLKKRGITPQFVSRKARENCLDYAALTDEVITAHELIINCTPLGTHPAIEESPALNYAALNEQHFLFDLVYNPPMSRFLQLGKAQGAGTANGADMLVHQANRSWDLWMKH
ncbi:MAG: shikimate dehydrogenase family protein [Flavobacteriaceae bacterium]